MCCASFRITLYIIITLNSGGNRICFHHISNRITEIEIKWGNGFFITLTIWFIGFDTTDTAKSRNLRS